MTTTIKLTKAAIEAVSLPGAGKRATYHVDGIPGLELRVSSTGVKTFSLVMRPAGKKLERVTLGRYPGLSPEQIRRRALEAVSKLAGGQSVVAEKKLARVKAKTLAEVFADYLSARKDLKPRTITDMGNAFREVFPDWLDKPLDKITPDMVKQRHQKHGEERSQARANLSMRYLRALFNFAAAEYQDDEGKPLVGVNPTKKLSQTRAWFTVDRKQTYLKPNEIGPWVQSVLGLSGAETRDYLTVLLLTGMRREEGLGLTWANVDLTANTLAVINPKNGRDHHLPLSDYLVEILTRRKSKSVSDYVFADHNGKRLSNLRYAQANIEKQTGIKITPHDLRRSFVTIAERLDFPFSVLKRLLNHAEAGNVTMGYIGADVDRLRQPMQQITDFVLKSAGIKAGAEVIQLRQAKR